LDPSLVIGFFVRTFAEFENLCITLHENEITSGKYPLFSVEDEDFTMEDIDDFDLN